MTTHSLEFTVFAGHRRLASGTLVEVALQARSAIESGLAGPISIYDDANGRVIDLDLRGTADEITARLSQGAVSAPAPPPISPPAGSDQTGEPRGRGRPKLGVVAREVTLLPRHWDWLSSQPGGASVALRKLVEEARRTSGARDRRRSAREAAYHFMSAIAGDLPGFEEAARALFRDDRRRFGEAVAGWPEDVRDHAVKLAFADLDPSDNP